MNKKGDIFNIIEKELNPNEIFFGSREDSWKVAKGIYIADLTEASELDIFDKAICGILQLDGPSDCYHIAEVLGFNIEEDSERALYKDRAEEELLNKALLSLTDYVMISKNYDGKYDLTSIGREYFDKKKKSILKKATRMDVFFDISGKNHSVGKKLFQKAEKSRTDNRPVPPEFRDENFLKTFMREQNPEVFDPEKGNSFTNLVPPENLVCKEIPIDFAIVWDLKEKKYRLIPVHGNKMDDDMIQPTLNDDRFTAVPAGFMTNYDNLQIESVDLKHQEDFIKKKSLSDADNDAINRDKVPAVSEPFRFWKYISEWIPKSEKYIFLKPIEMDVYIFNSIKKLVDSHPDLRIFLIGEFLNFDFSQIPNLYLYPFDVDGDFICLTGNEMFSMRKFMLEDKENVINPVMVFRYTDFNPIILTKVKEEVFSNIIPSLYTKVMDYLDSDFEIDQASLEKINNAELPIQFFLSETDLIDSEKKASLKDKKYEVYNRIKKQIEEGLIARVNDLRNNNNLDEIDDTDSITKLKQRLKDIQKQADNTYLKLQGVTSFYLDELKTREKEILDEEKASYYILDTNVFIDSPEILSKIKFPDKAVISYTVMGELDKKKTDSDEKTRKNASEALRNILRFHESEKDKRYKRILAGEATEGFVNLPVDLRVEAQRRRNNPDWLILDLAYQYKNKFGKEKKKDKYFLLTSDNGFRATAGLGGINHIRLSSFLNKINQK